MTSEFCPRCGKYKWQNWWKCVKCCEEAIKGQKRGLKLVKQNLRMMTDRKAFFSEHGDEQKK